MDDGECQERRRAPADWRADFPASAAASPPTAAAAEPRILELDGLRGLAALAIVIFHLQPKWLPLGWAAVDLFFGLSGFLITSIILKHGQSPRFLRQFYLRRGLRIWPIYYLTLLGFIVFGRRLPNRCDWSGFWYYLTYTQDLPRYWSSTAPRFHGYLNHTWSLAIEEQFYLLWPVLVLLVGVRKLPLLVLGCLGLSVAGRWSGWPTWLLLTRLDGLVLGALLAAFVHQGWATGPRTKGAFLGLIILGVLAMAAVASVSHLSGEALAVSNPGLLAVNVAGMGLIGLVVTHTSARWLAPLRWSLFTYLGKISYGLYLYHYIILRISAGRLRLWAPWEMPAGRQVVTLALCFLAAGLSWVLIEQPILRLKRRFEYEGTRPRVTTDGFEPGETGTSSGYHEAVPNPGASTLRRTIGRLHSAEKGRDQKTETPQCRDG